MSIIVPVLEEANLVVAFLRHLRNAAPASEIIVVDGGSRDGTADFCRGLADQVITSAPGRGQQMNAGATIARGDVLWFVHADSKVPSTGLNDIEQAMKNRSLAGGCFGLRIMPRRWIYRWRDAIGNVCVDLSGTALGDRGLFCRRDYFVAVGGYGQRPLFEDADLYRILRTKGGMVRLSASMATSARRYEAQGPVRTCLFYGLVMLLYAADVPRPFLERLVFRFSPGRRPSSRPIPSRRGDLPHSPKQAQTNPVSLQFNPNP